jgi:Tripartite tricarboxylate transporter TctB family
MPTDTRIRTYWREEFCLIAILLVFFAGIVGLAFRVPFDARLFPVIIGTAGLLLTLVITVQEVRRRRAGGADVVDEGDPAANAAWPRFATALLAAPVFGLVFWLFGFFVASLAAMLLMPPLMGYANRRLNLIVGAATVLVLALFFPYLVGVNLPHGLVGDWLIDQFRPT